MSQISLLASQLGGEASIKLLILKAIEAARRAQIDPRADQFAYCAEICSLSQLGRHEDPRKALRKGNRTIPNSRLELIEYDQSLPDPGIRALIADGLKQAGEDSQ